MKRKTIIILTLALLAACNPAPPPPTQIASPTESPTVTSSPTPAPTIMPSPTASFLFQDGPWLMITSVKDYKIAQGITFINLDGSGETVLRIPELLQSGLRGSPSGGFVSVYVQSEKPEFHLWVIKLPTLEVVRKILTHTEKSIAAYNQALEELDAGVSNTARKPFDQTFFPYLTWSPNGRYLAFTAALDGKAASDVYIYDTSGDTVRRISWNMTDPRIMGWSPDSKWIVFLNAGNIAGWVVGPSAVWVASVEDDELNQLYTTENDAFSEMATSELIQGWTSEDTFLVDSYYGETYRNNLREVNISTGIVRELYQGDYLSPVFDPQSKTTLIVVSDCCKPLDQSDPEPGIYSLSLDVPSLRLLFPNSFDLRWLPELGQFVGQDQNFNTFTFTPDGRIVLSFSESFELYPSPDGKWIVLSGENVHQLYNVTNETSIPLAEYGSAYPLDEFLWLLDSSGFFHFKFEGETNRIFLFLEKDNWQPVLFFRTISGFFSNGTLIMP